MYILRITIIITGYSFVCSLDAVIMRAYGGWRPVEQHGSITHGQEDSHPLVEVHCSAKC